MTSNSPNTPDPAELASRIKEWGRELGFQQVGIASADLEKDERRLERWLELGRHGEMSYMSRHGTRRSRPGELIPGTVSIISVRLDYLPPAAADSWEILEDGNAAFLSRYALGRDYHKVMRQRLQKLATRIEKETNTFAYRAFVDSAPVLEKAIAMNAGLGWIGKHTNLINSKAGSWFFLGELYTDLPLPADEAASEHCGSCRACIDVCPTRAIVGPWELDARRCISYLTIELPGSIPEEFRVAIGNRIYGCDDCQLVCPWNKFAKISVEPDFEVRHELDNVGLVELFGWSEEQFLERTAGNPIRRIGHERWLRNIAVALGNAPGDSENTVDVVEALRSRLDHTSEIVREHVAWALSRHGCDVAPASETDANIVDKTGSA
jgi:epoxyqueuosine reductase